jgi:hypothetical protein
MYPLRAAPTQESFQLSLFRSSEKSVHILQITINKKRVLNHRFIFYFWLNPPDFINNFSPKP